MSSTYDLVASAEPGVVFSSLAIACVPTLADDCLILIEENQALAYLIRTPSNRRTVQTAVRSDWAQLVAAETYVEPVATAGALRVRIPNRTPSPGEQGGYRGVVTYTWRDQHLPTPAETLAGAALVRCATALIAQQQLDEQIAAQQQQVQHLQIALDTNRDIGAAIGIIMASLHVTQDEAFQALRTVSQHTHRKLRDVAADVVFTGALPTPPAFRSNQKS